MAELPRVCLVGAGSSGIAVAKAFSDKQIPFDCYEKSDRVGGNWVFKNKNGVSSAYRSLHINTSRTKMQYADFPMPEEYPDFPHHELIARYFDAYVDHFGLRSRITFETGVERIERRATGGYDVTLDDGRTLGYDAIAIANGHHWQPQWPDPPFPGEFAGVQQHSHYYIDPGEPEDLVGKRVVVVGMGNSAMDIASELCRPGVAQKVWVVARHGAWVIPKYILGKPLDKAIPLPVKLPLIVRGFIARRIYALAVGRMEDYGLPTPDHQLGQAHPTVSSDFLVRVGSGDIAMKPNISELRGAEVAFVDGSVEKVDVIIYATGYKVSFPFFDPSFIAAPDNDLPLFRRVFKPGISDLFFFGLLQPLGATMPLAEAQGKWVAEYLTGNYALPALSAMQTDIDTERAAMFERYVRSRRHTMQVDFDDYMLKLQRELAAGRKRARRAQNALPVAVSR